MILTGNADTTRAIPGQRYGVAAHSSTTVPAPPPTCPCACHVNTIPSTAGVFCSECGTLKPPCLHPGETVTPFTHDDALNAPLDDREWVTVGPPDYWFVTKGNTLADDLKEHFSTEEQALERARRLNEFDVIFARRLTKKQVQRARALRELSGRSWFAEDDFYWLRDDVQRYAVEMCWDDGSNSGWETYASLAEVEEQLLGDSSDRVVDLDTGDSVPYSRTVSVHFGGGL